MATALTTYRDQGLNLRPDRLGPLLADVLLASLFLWAGLTKAWPFASSGELEQTIAAYQVLPAALTAPAAHLLPWWEIVWSLVLLSRRLVVPARGVLIGLLVLYGAVAVSGWARGLSVSCGCFGGVSGASGGYVAIRNLGILAGLALLWTPRLLWPEARKERT